MSQEEAQNYAKKLNLVYIEVSAKTGQNVPLAFEMITEKILEKIDSKEINPEEELGIKVGSKGGDNEKDTLSSGAAGNKPKSGGCCGGAN